MHRIKGYVQTLLIQLIHHTISDPNTLIFDLIIYYPLRLINRQMNGHFHLVINI